MANSTKYNSGNKDIYYKQNIPEIFKSNIDYFSAVISELNFEENSKWFLFHILCLLPIDKSEIIELSDQQFTRKINSQNSQNQYCKKWSIKHSRISLMRNLKLSGCQFVEIISGGMNYKNGEFFSTSYRMGNFYDLFSEIQTIVEKRNIHNIVDFERRRKILIQTIKEILFKKHGFIPVPANAHNKSHLNKKLNRAENDHIVEELYKADIRIDKTSVEQQITDAFDLLFEAGINWLNMGKTTGDYYRKLDSNLANMIDRLAIAGKRHNAPRLKFNGHQPS